MSIESAEAFIERLRTDKEFREKIGKAKNKEERMKLARASGFDFTAQELDIIRCKITDKTEQQRDKSKSIFSGFSCNILDTCQKDSSWS